MDKRLTIVQNLLAALHRDDSGQDLIEYALIAALIALGSIIGMDTVANEINSAFNIISKIGRASCRERGCSHLGHGAVGSRRSRDCGRRESDCTAVPA